jgi:RHS repeat-associated protein
MLTQVTNGSNNYIYRYDGLGSRVARIENGAEKRYVSGLVETDSSGNIIAYYVYGLGLISKITPTNQSYFYHFDGVGSTIGMSDSLGTMVNKYAYDAFGKVLNQEETIPNPFKYVGQFGVMDEENGLFYMRARYYDPEVGRFISKDPIGLLGGLNMYAYVQNNPINYIDPWGLIRYNAPPPRTVPPEGATLNALQCLEQCLQTATNNPTLDLLVTGGAEQTGHTAGSRHYSGEACDVAGPRFNPINANNVSSCAARCGFGTVQFETFPNNPNREHWHLEMPRTPVPGQP